MNIEQFLVELKNCAHKFNWFLLPDNKSYCLRGRKKEHDEGHYYCPINAVADSLRLSHSLELLDLSHWNSLMIVQAADGDYNTLGIRLFEAIYKGTP